MATSICVLVLLLNFAYADQPARIAPIRVITAIPQTSLKTLKTATSKESIVPWIAIGASTAILYHNDQSLLEDVQREGRHAGIGNEDKTKTVFEIGPYPVFRFPSDTGSAMYFLGDGWTHFGIAGGFYASGHFSGANRPHNTALQIVHGMVVSTFFSQAIKRSTGRESPSVQSEERGKWRPFPSVTAYNANTSMYDAFPSGHVMTATVTFTIINANYPEYSNYIIPIGATWITVLGLQMMNNGVH